MLLNVLWNPLGLVLDALEFILAAILVFLRPVGGTSDFQNLFREPTRHRFLQRIMARRSRASCLRYMLARS